MSNRINTIPTPTNDPESMLHAIRALKDVVERLTGQTPAGVNSTAPAGRVPAAYVQAVAPGTLGRLNLFAGDFWIQTGTDRLHYWTGEYWRLIQP